MWLYEVIAGRFLLVSIIDAVHATRYDFVYNLNKH